MGRERTDPCDTRAGPATIGLGGFSCQRPRRLLVRDLQGRDELWIVHRDAQGPDASSQEALDLDPRQFACPQGEGGEGLCRIDKWKTRAAFLAGNSIQMNWCGIT